MLVKKFVKDDFIKLKDNKLKNLFNWVPEINLLKWLKNNK